MTIHFYRDVLCLFLFFSLVFLTMSCGKAEDTKTPVEFELCADEDLPDELAAMIEEKKEEEFQFTYETSAYLYLAAGYGEQPRGEYVAAVREIYENEDGIFADMVLIDRSYSEDKAAGEPSVYPYIVLRCGKKGKPVFFL